MTLHIALFTRDLRVRDNPMLAAAAASADEVLPLFVVDDAFVCGPHSAPNRIAFLRDALADLDESLRARSSVLVLRRGNWVDEVVRCAAEVGADAVHVSDDVSGAAQSRLGRLADALARTPLVRHPGVTVVPPGAITPAGGGPFKVFTPYWKRWDVEPWRAVVAAPESLRGPSVPSDTLDTVLPRPSGVAPALVRGGETVATETLRAWAAAHLHEYEVRHDDLPGDATSRIAPYLHFGCLSPLEVATRLRDRDGAGPFVRQLCWRDFYHQILADRPETSRVDFRDRGFTWNDDDDAFTAWKEGRTGFPIVDAGMRQLLHEGFMHNRTRMVVASFLTKDLCIDWRLGAAHFMAHLVDGDVANNQLNWQWTAGTGSDTNPNRIFNPHRQAERFDPDGDYVRRYVEELRDIPGAAVHDPGPMERAARGYPAPIVDHHAAIAEYRERRAATT